MRRLGIKYLKEGMVVARPIHRIDGRIILGTGVTLTEDYILRLPLLGITSVYIEDSRLGDLVIEDIISDTMRTSSLEETKAINDTLASIYLKTKEKNGSKDNETILELLDKVDSKMTKLTKAIVEDFYRIRNPMLNLVHSRATEDYIYAHMVNVTAMSVLIGQSLGYKFDKLCDLAKGCIVHDIGIIIGVPMEIRVKPDNLSEEELSIIKKHPETAFNFLRKIRNLNIISAHVAYQHHERYNGGGYPRGLKKDEITEMAYIAGIADVYDAVTNNRSYKYRIMPDHAREFLSASKGHFFPDYIVEAFLKKIPAFPVASTVLLNGGLEAVVVRQNMSNLGRPVVRVIKKDEVDIENPYDIDLMENYSVVVEKLFE